MPAPHHSRFENHSYRSLPGHPPVGAGLGPRSISASHHSRFENRYISKVSAISIVPLCGQPLALAMASSRSFASMRL